MRRAVLDLHLYELSYSQVLPIYLIEIIVYT